MYEDRDPEKTYTDAEDLGLFATQQLLINIISNAAQRERQKLLDGIPTIYDISLDQIRPVNKLDMELYEILMVFARDISDAHKTFRASVDAHRLKVATAEEAGPKGL